AVFERLRLMRADVDHRLDGEDVTRLDLRAATECAVVWNLRVFVHAPADAMPDVLAHDRIAVCFRVRLHRPADVAQVPTGPTLPDRAFKTLFRHADQLQPIEAHPTDGHGRGRVADKTVQGRAHVNREDVALLQLVIGREAVHHLFIDRRADRIRETVIALEGRQRARVTNHLLCGRVEFERRNAGLHHAPQSFAHLPCELPRRTHLLQLFSRLADNHKTVTSDE